MSRSSVLKSGKMLTAFGRRLVVAVSLTLSWGAPAHADNLALVVGQSNYASFEKLPSAAVDAETLSATLRQAGVRVLWGADFDSKKLMALASDFQAAAQTADHVLIYYVGHSVKLDGRSILIPVDLDAGQIAEDGASAPSIEQLIPKDSKVPVVVMLDACWHLASDRDASSTLMQLDMSPCADAAGLQRPDTAVVSRGNAREAPAEKAEVSLFGRIAAESVLAVGVAEPGALAGELVRSYTAVSKTPPAMTSTLAGGLPAAMPQAVVSAASVPNAVAPSAIPAGAMATETPRAAAFEAAVSILRQLVPLGLNNYADPEMLIQGLQSGFDSSILPPRSESDLLLASRIVPELVTAGVPASSEMISDYISAYSFQLGRQQAAKLIESGRYRTMPDLQVFRETLKSPPTNLLPNLATAATGSASVAAPIRDLQAARIEGERFLAANRQRKDVSTLPTGLQYEIVSAGSGRLPLRRNRVRLELTMSRATGGIIQDTRRSGEPLETPISSLIPGLQEGLLLMREGGKMRFYVPSRLAYGETGNGAVGPHEVLICEVELLEVLK